jgi:multidrug efflux pump subunit AcrB
VKKNGIMLVDFAMLAERSERLSAHDAICRALQRFGPIMMKQHRLRRPRGHDHSRQARGLP